MEYDIRRGHHKNLEGEGLSSLMAGLFGEVRPEGDFLVTSYGALKELRVRVISKSQLEVVTVSDTGVPDDVALDTIRKFNRFLEAATGYTTKERGDRVKKKAKDGKL